MITIGNYNKKSGCYIKFLSYDEYDVFVRQNGFDVQIANTKGIMVTIGSKRLELDDLVRTYVNAAQQLIGLELSGVFGKLTVDIAED